MRDLNRTKRRILTAGAGAAVFTALEGLACGNPVEPGYRHMPQPQVDMTAAPQNAPPEGAAAEPTDAGADAP